MALELTGFRAIFVFVPWQWPKDDDKKPPKYYKVEQSEEIPF